MDNIDMDATPDSGREAQSEPARSSPLRREEVACIYGDLKALEERFNGLVNANAVRFEGDIKTLGLELGGEIKSLRELIENVEKRLGVEMKAIEGRLGAEMEPLRQLIKSLEERRDAQMKAERRDADMEEIRQLFASSEENRRVEMKAMEDRLRGEILTWKWGNALVLAFLVAMFAAVFVPELRELIFQR